MKLQVSNSPQTVKVFAKLYLCKVIFFSTKIFILCLMLPHFANASGADSKFTSNSADTLSFEPEDSMNESDYKFKLPGASISEQKMKDFVKSTKHLSELLYAYDRCDDITRLDKWNKYVLNNDNWVKEKSALLDSVDPLRQIAPHLTGREFGFWMRPTRCLVPEHGYEARVQALEQVLKKVGEIHSEIKVALTKQIARENRLRERKKKRRDFYVPQSYEQTLNLMEKEGSKLRESFGDDHVKITEYILFKATSHKWFDYPKQSGWNIPYAIVAYMDIIDQTPSNAEERAKVTQIQNMYKCAIDDYCLDSTKSFLNDDFYRTICEYRKLRGVELID